MNENTKTYYPNYSEDFARIKEFLTTFKTVGDESKYQNLIDQISLRKITDCAIDLNDVFDYNKDLGRHIIENTDHYIRLFNKAMDDLLPEPNLEFGTQFDAVNATRLATAKEAGTVSKLPPELFRNFTIRFIPPDKQQILPLREIRSDSIGHLVRFRGLVTRITQVKPMISVAAYTCSQCREETFQTVSGPSFMPLTVCQSLTCKSGQKPGILTLQTRGSKFIRYQLIRVQELSSEVPAGHIPRAMTIHCREDLTQRCQTGDVISVDGIFLPQPVRGFKQSLVNETYIEAQNIIVSPKCGALDSSEEPPPLEAKGNVYERLASAIAPEIYGLSDVKKSLLLQLVGGVTRRFDDGVKVRGDINVCLMGDPGVAKSQLLKWVTRISPRAVYTTGRGSSGVGLTAAVLRDPVTNEMALEGGALVLSDMGVCCIDEFDKMDENDRTAIYEVMEQQTVSIAKAGITTSLNARSSILAAANPVYSHYNRRKSIQENINLPAALLSRFDLMFLILDEPQVERDTELAKHIAYVHQHKTAPQSPEGAVQLSQLRKRIEQAREMQPIIPERLQQYIATSYVHMRQEAVDTPVTPRALLAVIRLSMALAKLRLADVVEQEDVDEALRLVNESERSTQTKEESQKEGGKEGFISAIFKKIREISRGKHSFKLNEIRKQMTLMGYTPDQLNKTIDAYEKLEIWHINKDNGTLVWVGKEDDDEYVDVSNSESDE